MIYIVMIYSLYKLKKINGILYLYSNNNKSKHIYYISY